MGDVKSENMPMRKSVAVLIDADNVSSSKVVRPRYPTSHQCLDESARHQGGQVGEDYADIWPVLM